MKISKISDLKHNPKNPRKATDEKIAMLKKSYETHGNLSGIIFNEKSKQLVGGHQTTKTLPPDAEIVITKKYSKPTAKGTTAEGYVVIDGEKIPYRQVRWDKDREMAANIAANQGAGAWDRGLLSEMLLELDTLNIDMDLTMFSEEELEAMIVPVQHIPPAGDPDHVPQAPKIATTKRGDIWILGSHRLLCGDSTMIDDVDRLMGKDIAELCFTSPPYADQRKYNDDKELKTTHLATFISTAFGKAKYFAVNLGISRKDGYIKRYWDDYIAEAEKSGLQLLSWNVWDRQNALSLGNITAMFPIEHEWIFVFGSEGKKLNRTVPNKYAGDNVHGTTRAQDGALSKSRAKPIKSHRPLGTVFRSDVARYTGEEDHAHPAMFPVVFPEAYILECTQIDDWVYEPFAGSGTTIIACEKNARKCLAMELDPIYCQLIIERWCKYTGQEAYLLDGNGNKTSWSQAKEMDER